MKLSEKISCKTFPCKGIEKNSYQIPNLDIDPNKIKIVMISEVSPLDPKDYFYSLGNPFYMETTKQAFNDAGYPINSINDIINLGVYITTAVKCAKTGTSISIDTIKECSFILEEELKLFPNAVAYLLLGDVAIKSFNYISKRNTNKLAISKGSTYKLRSQSFYYEDKRIFPSYIITGKNFLIETSKRKMIAEDINNSFKEIE
ncbi:MAG TPA: uracil-DNA glycosylase family protein [Methanofastidiosum sp.]|nr:uracil-DNA glycosylase family protein [Methanofastidiosum sp.]HQF89133.1 uracil-DNA glycosylase family protein [Methanofastidiosum sp.]HQK84718.1 uracil-DNA glycosylase family protein [Methanofastidiosum sp.]